MGKILKFPGCLSPAHAKVFGFALDSLQPKEKQQVEDHLLVCERLRVELKVLDTSFKRFVKDGIIDEVLRVHVGEDDAVSAD